VKLYPIYQILCDLINRMPNMQLSICIWRAIVKHKRLLLPPLLRLPFIQLVGNPIDVFLAVLRMRPRSMKMEEFSALVGGNQDRINCGFAYGNVDFGSLSVDDQDLTCFAGIIVPGPWLVA
jgi:hypothetical protein